MQNARENPVDLTRGGSDHPRPASTIQVHQPRRPAAHNGGPIACLGEVLTPVSLSNTVRETRSTAHSLDPQALSTARLAFSLPLGRRFEPRSKSEDVMKRTYFFAINS